MQCPIAGTGEPGAITVSDCSCPPSQFRDASTNQQCRPCKEGYYCPDGTAYKCPEHAHSLNASTHLHDCYCTPGFYNGNSATDDPMCIACNSPQSTSSSTTTQKYWCNGTPSKRRPCNNLLVCSRQNEW
eukprot:3938534-Rhodomonas_salina.1